MGGSVIGVLRESHQKAHGSATCLWSSEGFFVGGGAEGLGFRV